MCARTHQTTDELIKLRRGVIEQLAALYDAASSSVGFLDFCLTHPDITVRFTSEIVLVYLEAIFVFQHGVRTNASDLMRAGRLAFLPVWFGRNHPTYQQIVLGDEVERILMPSAVRHQVEAAEAVTKCLPDKHEGPRHQFASF